MLSDGKWVYRSYHQATKSHIRQSFLLNVGLEGLKQQFKLTQSHCTHLELSHYVIHFNNFLSMYFIYLTSAFNMWIYFAIKSHWPITLENNSSEALNFHLKSRTCACFHFYCTFTSASLSSSSSSGCSLWPPELVTVRWTHSDPKLTGPARLVQTTTKPSWTSLCLERESCVSDELQEFWGLYSPVFI